MNIKYGLKYTGNSKILNLLKILNLFFVLFGNKNILIQERDFLLKIIKLPRLVNAFSYYGIVNRRIRIPCLCEI